MKVLVLGLLNVETNVPVKAFPLEYTAIEYPFMQINTNVSGVGYNLLKAFLTLGDEPDIISYLGNDIQSEIVLNQLKSDGIKTDSVSRTLKQTPVSVILVDKDGKRQIFTDLKDIQENTADITPEIDEKIKNADIVCACNINFSRSVMKRAAELHKTVATDVHALSNVYDVYNKDFIMQSDILFMSDEYLPLSPEKMIDCLYEQHDNKVIVIGMGNKGAMLLDREFESKYFLTAANLGNVVNTVGAGDALFSSFLHYYAKGMNCIDALRRAETFAALKIQHNGAALGFSSERDVETALKYANISVTKL